MKKEQTNGKTINTPKNEQHRIANKSLMTYNEFIGQFRQHIQKLTYENQFGLAISVCKRLFPDYKDFFLQNNWGDPNGLLDAISYCETFFKNGGNSDLLKEYAKKVFDNCPHSDDFENASYAINASGAVHGTLEFLLYKNPNYIYEIGTYFTDTIDFKIQDDNEDITEKGIDAHLLMMEARTYLLSGTYEEGT